MNRLLPINGTSFTYFNTVHCRLAELHERITGMREAGRLGSQELTRIREFFKIKGIYHSNAIEGNALTIAETGLVVKMGMTLTGKSLNDQAEAKTWPKLSTLWRRSLYCAISQSACTICVRFTH